jgi:hypothetical protein
LSYYLGATMASWHTLASWRQFHFQFDHVFFMDKLINALLWTLIWFLASNPDFTEQPTTTATKLEANLTSDFMVTVQVTKKKANFLPYKHLWWPTFKLHVNLWSVTCKILDKLLECHMRILLMRCITSDIVEYSQ